MLRKRRWNLIGCQRGDTHAGRTPFPGVGSYLDLYPALFCRIFFSNQFLGFGHVACLGLEGEREVVKGKKKKKSSSADLMELGRANKTKVRLGKSRAQLGEWASGSGLLVWVSLCG